MEPLTSHARSRGALLLAATALFAIPASAHAAPAPEPDPEQQIYHLDVALDLSLIVGASVLWATPYLVATTQTDAPWCGTPGACALSDVNAFDRTQAGHHMAEMRSVADATWAVPALGFLIFDVADVGGRRWHTWLTDFVVIGETALIDGVLGEIFSRSIRRPRPFLYEDGVYPDERTQPSATLSFFATDVSQIFGLASAVSYSWSLRHPNSTARKWVFLGMYLLSSTVAVARVLSGDNFMSDTIVGAIVGGSIGVAWPAMRNWMFRQDQLTLSVAPPPAGASGIVASLGGRF